MKLWILTFAYDCDEHCVGAFSTEGLAIAAAKALTKHAAADKMATIWTSIVPVELDGNELVDIELCGTGD